MRDAWVSTHPWHLRQGHDLPPQVICVHTPLSFKLPPRLLVAVAVVSPFPTQVHRSRIPALSSCPLLGCHAKHYFPETLLPISALRHSIHPLSSSRKQVFLQSAHLSGWCIPFFICVCYCTSNSSLSSLVHARQHKPQVSSRLVPRQPGCRRPHNLHFFRLSLAPSSLISS